MEEVDEILDRLDSPSEDRRSIEEKHEALDEKLSEIHEQLELLDQHLNSKR